MMHDSLIMLLFRMVNIQKKDTNSDIAALLLKHYDSIPNSTINDLADLCYVSPASITRFVKAIGFESFQEFKDASKNTLKITATDYSPSFIKSDKIAMTEIFDLYTHKVISNIMFAKETLQYDQLDDICTSIKNSDEILVLGLEFSTLLSQHIQSRFALMNKYINIALSYDEQLEEVKKLKKGSTVIILSLEGGFFYRREDVIKVLLEKDIKLILITMNKMIKVLNEFENKQIILCGNMNENTEGRISLLYVLEIIIMYYCIYYSFT